MSPTYYCLLLWTNYGNLCICSGCKLAPFLCVSRSLLISPMRDLTTYSIPLMCRFA